MDTVLTEILKQTPVAGALIVVVRMFLGYLRQVTDSHADALDKIAVRIEGQTTELSGLKAVVDRCQTGSEQK